MSKTKDKILEAANTLFAKKGFDGASVRDIAKEAGVNLGAINYHFESKENLFCELIIATRVHVDNDLQELFDEKEYSFKEFLLAFYDRFCEFGDEVSNGFRLMLNDTISPDVFDKYDLKKNFRPPGATILFKVIDQEFGDKMSAFAKIWVIKQLFTIIVHYVVMGNSSLGRYHLHNFPVQHITNQVHTMLIHTIDALVEYALKHNKDFEDFDMNCSMIKED